MTPQEVSKTVNDSQPARPRRRGFPTGQKWSFVPMGERRRRTRKYLVVNADEMEPGTFKDRLLLEGDPHQLIEGMILSAYAIQADVAYIFLRLEHTSWRRSALHAGHRRGLRAPATWARTSWAPASAWSCTCTSAPGATCAARRPACSTPWKASGPPRAPSRPFPQVSRPVGQADRRQQRRDALQRAAHRRTRRRVVPGA